MSFSDKVVIIIDASSGIGAATALLFSKEKASVVLVGRSKKKLKTVEAQCEKFGNKLLLINANFSNYYEVPSIINQTIDKFGKLDILVNNARIVRGVNNIMKEFDIQESYDEVISTVVNTVFNITQLAKYYLMKTKGNIINISNVARMKQLKRNKFVRKFGVQSTSKVVMNYMTKGAAMALADYGVRVNAISPGPVITDVFTNFEMEMDDVKDFKLKTMAAGISSSEEVQKKLYLASD